jgi:hypothetical protein
MTFPTIAIRLGFSMTTLVTVFLPPPGNGNRGADSVVTIVKLGAINTALMASRSDESGDVVRSVACPLVEAQPKMMR